MPTGVAVQFREGLGYRGRHYTYLTDHIVDELKVGDIVRVPVGKAGHTKARVSKVNVPANSSYIEYKQVLEALLDEEG